MKLTYKILWFDDQPETMKPSVRQLTRKMRDLGFYLKVEFKEEISPDAIEELGIALSQYNPYDLIIFDHDLGSCQGTNIAERLRKKIFTDMVYYSATTVDVLRKAIYDAKIDGVFLINKDDCVNDLERILKDHIKKNCDLNNMRGIVLDAISEMEVILRRYLLKKLHKDTNGLRSERLIKLKDNFNNRSKSWKKAADSMTEEQMLSHFSNPLKTDFNTIRQTLSSCEETWENLKDDQLLDELQKLRNVFAHESYEWNPQDNSVTICIAGEKRSFQSSDFLEIRQKLLTMFDDINAHCKEDN